MGAFYVCRDAAAAPASVRFPPSVTFGPPDAALTLTIRKGLSAVIRRRGIDQEREEGGWVATTLSFAIVGCHGILVAKPGLFDAQVHMYVSMEIQTDGPTMAEVTVFGGNGFLGSWIVGALSAGGHDVRVVTRRPQGATLPTGPGAVRLFEADILEAPAVEVAVAGTDAVVNAVGHYVETGSASFEAVHVEGAERLARAARAADVARLLQHISGIGSDPDSTSPYVRSRGERWFRKSEQSG